MRPAIAIVGAGQLGSRYLQGLKKVAIGLDVYVVDQSPRSLEVANTRWAEVDGNELHRLTLTSTVSSLPRHLDLVIVATTADVRLNIVRQVADRSDVDHWILEKLVTLNPTEIPRFIATTDSAKCTWVNLPYRAMKWHNEIASVLTDSGPLKVTVEGSGYGLLTNAIHYLDLVTYWTKAEVVSLVCDFGPSDFIPSKRSGFVEANGAIHVSYSDGSMMKMTCDSVAEPDRVSLGLNLTLTNDRHFWQMDEVAGTFVETGGVTLKGRVELQSELTAGLVSKILLTGRCALPRLDQTTHAHEILLQSVNEVWRLKPDNESRWAPIT